MWSPKQNVLLERELWLQVLGFHIKHGLAPADSLVRYAAAAPVVDLDSIRRRELVTRHDVKARIEEFNALARLEYIHLGMTSADVVDNISQIKMRDSMGWLTERWPYTFSRLHRLLNDWPMRGIKGAVGTHQDQLDLLGSPELCDELDRKVANHFGFRRILANTRQTYPRSMDLEVVSALAACVGDHRHPAQAILHGYVNMVAGYSGETWNEGDVSTSVVRRLALPGAFFAAALIAGDEGT
jgi:adenylosuccinate lyase